jgi:hypothetical protein
MYGKVGRDEIDSCTANGLHITSQKRSRTPQRQRRAKKGPEEVYPVRAADLCHGQMAMMVLADWERRGG